MESTSNFKTDEELYLSYVNDFLSVAAFASYYGLTGKEATDIINEGRRASEGNK